MARSQAAGTDVDALLATRGATEGRDCAAICRGDIAEYLGAALLVREDALDPVRVCGKNFKKLKCTHSEIGIDVVGVRLSGDPSEPLQFDEKIFLLSAKHSMAIRLDDSVREVANEFATLSEGVLAQEIRMLRLELKARSDPRAGRVVLFFDPILTEGIAAECVELRASFLVDESRMDEILSHIHLLDRIPATVGRCAWIFGSERSLSELDSRVD